MFKWNVGSDNKSCRASEAALGDGEGKEESVSHREMMGERMEKCRYRYTSLFGATRSQNFQFRALLFRRGCKLFLDQCLAIKLWRRDNKR